VTGATGFLGRSVVRTLAAGGGKPVASGRGGRPDWLAAGTPYARIDLAAPEHLADVFASHGVTAVIHCAAYGVDHRQQDLLTAADVNVRGTLALYLAADAAGIAPFVHVGTSFEYGHCDRDMTEETPLRPVGIYGATKAAASMVLLEAGRLGRKPPIVARVFGMYGPGEGDHKLVPQIVHAARTRTPLDLTAGEQVRDYQFVGDVARALAFLATLPAGRRPPDEVFNIASGEAVTIRAFAERVADHLGAADLLRFGSRSARPDRVARNVGDPSRFGALCRSCDREDLLRRTPMADAMRGFSSEQRPCDC